MQRRRAGSKTMRIVAALGLVALSVLTGSMPAHATVPTLDTPPERLYTGVNDQIAFVGTDLISGDDRDLVLTATSTGCNPTAGNNYALTNCARVQMTVSSGSLEVGVDTILGGPLEPEGIATGGAIIESTQLGGTLGGLTINLNGTQAQLNDALATLTWDPPTDYEYMGGTIPELDLHIVDGPTTDSIDHTVELVVEGDNEDPDLTVPAGPYNVAANSATQIPTVTPPVDGLGEFFVEDADVDENDGQDEMLLVMFATCGNFELRGGALTLYSEIEDALLGVGLPQVVVDLILPALPPEVTGLPFTTGTPGDPHVALAGVGEFDEINYALSEVTFNAPSGDASCDVWTIVSDLGNNGMPLQYVGSPIGGQDQPQPGFEVPDFGIDFDTVNFIVGAGAEVSVPANLSVSEGDTVQIPIAVSSANHPAFDVSLTAADVTTSAADYTDPTSPASFAQNAPGPVNVAFDSTEDPDEETPDETLTVTIALVGSPGVTLGNDTVTITILDDGDAAVDNDPPDVTINQGSGQSDPTSSSPIVFDVLFNETVTGFDGADVSFAGSTVGGILVANVSGSGDTYTVSVTGMNGVGTVVASIGAGAATDSATNDSTASTSTDNQVTFDNVDPTVTINQDGAQADPTSTSPITFDVLFSEPVTGFTDPDVDLSSSTAGGTLLASVSGSGATYTVTVTGMTTNGDVVAAIAAGAAGDLAGNPSGASTSTDNTVAWIQPVDNDPPDVTINQGAAQADPTSSSPIVFDVLFNETVTGFDGADVSFAGSTVGGILVANVSGSGDTYTVSVTGMNGVGTVVASIGAGAATDSATNDSTASTSTDNEVTFDNVDPTVTINQDGAQADPTSTSPITFDVLFSEPVTGFTDPDIDLSSSTAGGTLAASVAGSGATYTVTVTGMTTNGDVVAAIAASAATDLAGNPSGASTSTDNTVAWVQGADPAPTVTINQGSGQADPTSTSPITFDVLFSEPVTGFSAADVDLSSSTAGGTLAANVSGSGPGYTVTVTGMTTNGDVIATIPADAASDGTNASLASTSTDNTVTWTQGGTTTTTTTTTTPEDGSTTTTDPGAATTTLAGGSGGTGAANVNAAGAGVSPTAAARGAGSSLPSTGADAAVSVGMALSLLLIGAGLVLASRHQRSVASGRDPRGR